MKMRDSEPCALSVDYDFVAPTYDRRYSRHPYDGVVAALRRFAGNAPGGAIGEVGCGTGHWLANLSAGGYRSLAGIDRSRGMLDRARGAAPSAQFAQGEAERLCWIDRCLDRVFCVNALHHFRDPRAFMAECGRVLRAGAGFLTIGLDPHAGVDDWWVYDVFPAALQVDRMRFAAAATIREWLVAAGFHHVETEIAEHIIAKIPFETARTKGLTDRNATSQLMLISDEEYAAGIARLRAERPVLRSDVLLYATTAWT